MRSWEIPDEEPITCADCGCRAYEVDTDGWTHDEWDNWCPDCPKNEVPC